MVTARTGIARCVATPAIVAAMLAWPVSRVTANLSPCTAQPLPTGAGKWTCISFEIARAAMIITMTRTAPAPTRRERVGATHQKLPGIRHRLGSLGMDKMPVAPPAASPLPDQVDRLWDERAELTPDSAAARDVITAAVDQIDAGRVRVAWLDPDSDAVVVDERAKRAILLAFRVLPMVRSQVGEFRYHDRVPLTSQLDGVRAVAGAIVRWGAYVAPGAVLMPSFVNIGAYVDSGTMVDTWATVGSCAQIGRNVHLAGGVGIGGVLEPVGARPVIVEDGAFVGSRAVIVEGVIVGEQAVIAPLVVLSASVPIIDVTGPEPVEH